MQAKQQGRSPRWMQSQGQQSPDQQSLPQTKPNDLSGEQGSKFGYLGDLLSYRPNFKRPEKYKDMSIPQMFADYNKELGKSGKEYAQLIYKYPGASAAAAGTGVFQGTGIELGADLIELALKKSGAIDEKTPPNLIREYVEKVQNEVKEGKTPEEIRKLGKIETLGSFVPLSWLLKGGAKILNQLSKKIPKGPTSPPDLGWQGGGEGSPFKTGGLQMGPEQGPPPKTMQEMVSGVQGGQETLQMRTQAQKTESAASLKPQPLKEP